jgi:hypothetical protein
LGIKGKKRSGMRRNQRKNSKAVSRKEIIPASGGQQWRAAPRSDYRTDWIIAAPTVKAITTPTIITLDACWVRRITEETNEIPSMAAINAAGAITTGISLVNQMSVCIFFYLAVKTGFSSAHTRIYEGIERSYTCYRLCVKRFIPQHIQKSLKLYIQTIRILISIKIENVESRPNPG